MKKWNHSAARTARYRFVTAVLREPNNNKHNTRRRGDVAALITAVIDLQNIRH